MKLEKVFAIKWAKLYPMYVRKAEAKGRTADEVDQVIRWLTGYTPTGLRKQNEGEERACHTTMLISRPGTMTTLSLSFIMPVSILPTGTTPIPVML